MLDTPVYKDADLQEEPIRIGILTALLRVADELDFSGKRVPLIHFEIAVKNYPVNSFVLQGNSGYLETPMGSSLCARELFEQTCRLPLGLLPPQPKSPLPAIAEGI